MRKNLFHLNIHTQHTYFMKKTFLSLLAATVILYSDIAFAQTATKASTTNNSNAQKPTPAKPKPSGKKVKSKKTTTTKAVVKKLSAAPIAKEPKPMISLVSGIQCYTPVYVKDSADAVTKVLTEINVPIILRFPDSPAFKNDTILFNLDSQDLPGNPVLETHSMVVSSTKLDSNKNGILFLHATVKIQTAALQKTLDIDHMGVLTISGRSENSVIINCQKSKEKANSKMMESGSITILNKQPIDVLVNFSKTAPLHEQMIDIPVKLSGDGPGKDSTYRLVFYIDSNYLLNNAQINPLDTVQTISKSDWTKATVKGGDSTYKFHLRIQTNSKNDTSSDPQTTFIGIKGIPGQAQEVDLVNYNPNKPFWVELGSNFDLLNGLQANNLYGGIFMDKKDVQPIFKKRKDKKYYLSLFGGVYESKTISTEESNSSNLRYLDNSVFNPPDTIAIVHRDTGKITKTTSINNLGIFFEPQMRLTNKLADQNGFHIFLSLWTEIVWQKVATNFDYSNTGRYSSDTVKIASLPQNVTYKVASFNSDYRSHYLGMGLPLYFKYNNYNLYVNPVFGWSTQVGIPSSATSDSSFYNNSQAAQKWQSFYLVQFRLNEEQYGFAFTGEIRGVIGEHPNNYKPAISLALSKKFDLSKLIEFTK